MFKAPRIDGVKCHLPLPVDARHFDHWLDLFEQTARDLFSGQIAEYFVDRARRVAASLELGIASSHGVLLAKGERFDVGSKDCER